ncbi:MAG: 2-C-methyl-D-erythritol 2,4-cyclodiphosphate synthase [Peptococcaceae bacterium]|nr:2-C-methyl-D-erythritol 2,4-cyclodiphosphate synthase [Peptococcaceae bacterium]
MRVGLGYDVHQLVENRKLILGGVEIPFEKGLLGHSDADVLVHALMDAMFGAMGMGDIGQHFPDTDPQYKGANSMKLLEACRDKIAEKGYGVYNLDVTICAQAPKMAPHLLNMRQNIADTLGIDISMVNIKATTTEHLGFVGDGKGMSAYATCLLEEIDA